MEIADLRHQSQEFDMNMRAAPYHALPRVPEADLPLVPGIRICLCDDAGNPTQTIDVPLANYLTDPVGPITDFAAK